MVFFIKKQKISSLCADHEAPYKNSSLRPFIHLCPFALTQGIMSKFYLIFTLLFLLGFKLETPLFPMLYFY